MRVALSGYYGFGNHGDEALLAGLIAGLERRGHVPVALSADPEATRRLHGVEARHRTRGLVASLRGVDAVVSGGGGLLQDATSGRSLAYYLGVLVLARLMRRRAVVFGQSVGPLSPRGRRWTRWALRGVPVSVRDRASAELLGTLGLEAHVGADAALAATALRLALPAGNGTEERSQPPRAVLAPRGDRPEHTAALADAAGTLAQVGFEVRAVALHPAQDRAAADLVQRRAAGPSAAPAAFASDGPGDWRETVAAIARARVVIATRLHALVFAAGLGLPHVGLVYDPKVAGFLSESGGVAFDPPFAADEIARAAVRAADAPRSRAAAQQWADRADAAMDWLDATLRNHA